MASVVGQGIGTIFAALTFSGANFLFSKLDKNGFEAETQRHNRAMEELAKAKEVFYENEVKHHDKIQELRDEIKDASDDMERTNRALELLSKVRTIVYKSKKYNREPRISDFYQPSSKMRDYEYAFAGLMAAAGGYGLSLLI